MTFRSLRLLAALTLLVLAFEANGQTGKVDPKAAPETHLGRGYEALKQDRYEDAAREFRAALALDPSLVERAQFPLGVALFEMRRFGEARKELEAVQRGVGSHPNVQYYLGRIDLESGNFEEAVRNLSRAARKPPLPDTAYYLGFAYAQKGDYVAAEKWLKEAEKLNPRDSRIPFQLGTVYKKLERDEDAKNALARSSALRRRDNDEVQMRVECAQKLARGPREEARAFCDQLYDPGNVERLTKLGTLYGEHGDIEAALKPLQRAAELAPQSPQTQYNLAYTYYQLNQFEAARTPLEAALKRWPDLFQLNALYGAVLFRLEQYAAAHEVLSRAHNLNAQDPATMQMLYASAMMTAGSETEAKRFSEAIRYLKEAAKLKPAEAEPHQRMAQVYASMGRAADASNEQREADRLARP